MLGQYSVDLQRFLGQGAIKTSIASSAVLAVISVFYVFSIGSYIQATVYYFLLRVTYIKPSNDFIFGRSYDSIVISSLSVVWMVLALEGKFPRIFVSSIFGILLVAGAVSNHIGLLTFLELATLPLIVVILFCQRYYHKSLAKKRKSQRKETVIRFRLRLTLNYLALIAIALGIYSILLSLSVIIIPQNIPVDKILETKHFPIDNNGYEIFIFFSALSPMLLIVIFFCLPIKLLIKSFFQRILKSGMIWWSRSDELAPSMKVKRNKWRIICLSLLVLFSISLALIPQLPAVNKDNQQIGSDSDSYEEWITSLRQAETTKQFFETALSKLGLHGDRSLALIFLFSLTSVTGAPALDTIEYLPIILGPALVLVIYFLTRELTTNETASLFAASLTALGYFQVSMGIYAGFYANWIALLLGYSSLIFFFRFLRKSSSISPLIFFILLLAALFSHALTWSVISIVMGLFLVISLFRKTYPRKRIIVLLLLIAFTVAIDVVKTISLESIGSAGGVELTLSLAQANIGLKDLGSVWSILVDATQEHFGGIFCNFIILGLIIYWFIRSNLSVDYNTFIVVFLMIGIPSLFLGDWIVQSRVFYNIPFQIPAAIALTYLSAQRYAIKLMAPTFVWLVAISLWTVSNFYEVLPS
jgi:hypothetical protein